MTRSGIHITLFAVVLLAPALASGQLRLIDEKPYAHQAIKYHLAAYMGLGETTNSPDDYHGSQWGNQGYPANLYTVGTDIPFPFVVYTTSGRLKYPTVTITPRAGLPAEVAFRYESEEPFYIVDAPYKSEEEAERVIAVDHLVPMDPPLDCPDGLQRRKRPRLFYMRGPLSTEVTPRFTAHGTDGEIVGGGGGETLQVYSSRTPFLVYLPDDPDHPIASNVFIKDGDITYRYRHRETFDAFPGPLPQEQWDSHYRQKDAALGVSR